MEIRAGKYETKSKNCANNKHSNSWKNS